MALAGLGYTGIDGKPLMADGDFGGHTRHAVDAFQKAHRLDADGKFGKDTLAELGRARDRPLISQATHASHGLYAAIGKQLPAGTQVHHDLAAFADHLLQNEGAPHSAAN